MGIDNDQEHYEVMVKRQTKDDGGRDTPKIYVSFPVGSTVASSMRGWGGPWTNGTREGKGSQNHHGRSSHIYMTKTGKLVT